MIDDTSGARPTAVQESDPESAEEPTEQTGEQVNAEAGAAQAADTESPTDEAPSQADTATGAGNGAATELAGDGNGATPAGTDSQTGEATAETDAVAEAPVSSQTDAKAGAAESSAAESSAAESSAAESSAAESTGAEGTAAEGAAQSGATDAAAGDAAGGEAPVPAAVSAPEEPMTMAQLMDIPDNEVKSLKHGDVVEGTVVRIDPDEILVDFGGKSEGVVSNRELMGRRGPRDDGDARPELNVGDQVLVYVLQPESPEGHAVLSLRRAGLERKWRAMQERFDAGEIVEARVIDHNKGGLIVDLGVRGFVPISQIVDFPRRPRDEQPRDAAQEIAEKLQPFVGRTLRLKILEVNRKANRLILSEKVALYEERREKRDELFSSLETGQRVKGVVRSIAPFGVFVDLGGIDGLVHKSELSWNKVNNPEGAYEIGEEVEAEVIDINHERGRISLSIRRLQADPWQESVAKYNIGDVIDGQVTKLVNFGAFVRVEEGLEGLIHISELSNQRVAHPGDVVQEGQQVKLRIISLDSERHRLGLSLKQAEDRPAPSAQEREDRPKRDRGGRRDRQADYRPEDATAEPEGGIESSMAAAFASSGLLDQFRSDDEVAPSQDQAAKADAKGDAKPDAPEGSQATAEEQPQAKADATIEPIDDVTGEGQIDQVADATAVEDELRGSDAAGTAPAQTRGAGRPPASKPVADDAPGTDADETAAEAPAEEDAAAGSRTAKDSGKAE